MHFSHPRLSILAFMTLATAFAVNVSAATDGHSQSVRACELFLTATRRGIQPTDETVQRAIKRLYPQYSSADSSAKERVLLLKRVLAGESHAVGVRSGEVRLREETFQRLRTQTIQAISSPADLDTLTALLLLKAAPEARESSPEYRRLAPIIAQNTFDLDAFINGESPARSLVALAEFSLNPHELRLYLMQSLYRRAATETITEPLVLRLLNAFEALGELHGPDTASRVYDDFLRRIAKDAGGSNLSLNDDRDRAFIRMMLLTGHQTPDDISWVVNLNSPGGLMRNLRTILISELGESGFGQRPAIVLKGAAQVIARTIAPFHHGGPREDALINAFETLARLFQTARTEIAIRKGAGEFLVDVRPIGLQLEPGQNIRFKKIRIVDDDKPGWSRIEFTKGGTINSQKFMRQQITHSTVVGKRLVLVTFGDPIEVLPASILARLIYEQSRKDIAAIISIDVKNGDDQPPHGAFRRLEEGVFAADGEESGSTNGEDYAQLAARYFPTFIVNGEIRPHGVGTGRLFQRLTRLLELVGGGDTIIAVDVGGGVLTPTSIKHQYLHLLADLHRVRGVNSVLLAEMLLGLDEINGAEAVLLKAGTRYHPIEGRYGDMQYRLIHETFGQWRATQVWPIARLAQTWDSALHGEYGAVALVLPMDRVLDPKDPLNPFTFILPQMQGVFFVDLRSMLGAMGR